MKIKKILSVLSALIVMISAMSCGDSNNEPEDNNSSSASVTEKTTKNDDTKDDTKVEKKDDDVDLNDYITPDTPQPALWKVTDPESGNELYMMGTIHVAGDNTFPLPDYIMDVYENCDGVAVEYDVNALQNDISLMQEYLMEMLYTDGTTISDHLSESSYEAGKEYLRENSTYNSMLDYYMPGFWISQIETLSIMKIKNLSTEGVDSTFLTLADKDGKEIINIENLQIQANAVTAFSDELADHTLSEVIADADDLDGLAEQFAEIYNYWAVGDIDKLEDYSEELESLPAELRDDYEDYMQITLYDRNVGMAERASEFLENGDNYFFMVGAMHFAGNRGVDDLLEEMGYTVERVK